MTSLMICPQRMHRMRTYRPRHAYISLVLTLLAILLVVVGPTQPTAAQSDQLVSSPLNPAAEIGLDWQATVQEKIRPDATVLISVGEFQMGCDSNHNGGYAPNADEMPLHTVYLDGYEIDQTEVTNNAYVAFLNARGSNTCEGVECVDLDDPNARIMLQNGQFLVQSSYGNHPATEVTWYGAHAYCSENGMRLPTEAEWEKAARGLSARAFPWGDNLPNCTLANSRNEDALIWKFCVGDTRAVGSYLNGASPYGALDMAGNVWEWTNDWYSETYYSNSPHANPQGPESGSWKVIRGGSWDYPRHGLLTANRYRALPSHSGNSIGFRCVATLGQ